MTQRSFPIAYVGVLTIPWTARKLGQCYERSAYDRGVGGVAQGKCERGCAAPGRSRHQHCRGWRIGQTQRVDLYGRLPVGICTSGRCRVRIVVTGAGGFIGEAVVAALARQGTCDITAVDMKLDRNTGSGAIDYVEGNIADREVRARALAGGCDALVHLATVPGGAAEQLPMLAKQVNLDGSIALIDEAAQAGKPKIVFASSIAVVGEVDREIVDHRTPIAPKLVCGAHKAMMEIWLGTPTRGARGSRMTRMSAPWSIQ